jgi:hypothetical protein
MRNNTFCSGVFSTRCLALMGDHGRYLPISLREVPINTIHLCIVKHREAFVQRTNVPVFNGSPPPSL